MATQGISTPTFTQEPPTVTNITIDGMADDWTGRQITHNDPVGDAEEGYLDLGNGYVFVNQNALYFLIEIIDPAAPFVHFDMQFQAGSRKYQISWGPGQQNGFLGDITSGMSPIGEISYSRFAFGPALEGRVDLRDLGSPSSLSLISINVMAGECCDYPAWRAVEQWQPDSSPVMNEMDPPRLFSDEPQYELARRFELPEGYIAELLYAPPAPELTGIARSQNGLIFLQHGGLSSGISTLDPASGEVTRILDLATSGYSSIVGGPGDTVFINEGDEVWQVNPDGSYVVWGKPRDGQVKFFTSDGRALGYSHDKTRVLELMPDGSSREIAAGFIQIYDIVAAADGTLFVSDVETGNIIRVNPDGTRSVLAEHVLIRDPLDLAIDPAGNLFLNSVASGFVQVDRNSGAFTRYDSAHSICTIHQADFEFIEPGRAVFVDPTWSTVTWADINTGQNGMIVSNQGVNTWAADVGPDDLLYVGAWGCGDEIPAQVLRIADNGQRDVYVDGLRGQVDDIAFAPDGGLYISTNEPGQFAAVYYVSSEGGQPVEIPGAAPLRSMTIDPITGHLLATRGSSSVLEITPNGLLTEHRLQFPVAVTDLYIDSAPDGSLFVYTTESGRFYTGPEVQRWVYRLNLEGGPAEIIFQFDHQGCCVMGNLSVDPQGTIWWMVDPEFLIYRVTSDGNASIFARNLPIDPAAVVVDSQGDVYFTSPGGIYRIFKEP